MLVQNNGKARILRIFKHDCDTAEALNKFAELYKPQKKEDVARRQARLRYGAKKRDLIAPKWRLDKFVRILLAPGRTEVPDVFAHIVRKVLAGEIAIGRMSISGSPEDLAPEKKPTAAKRGRPKKKQDDAVGETKED